MEISLGFLWNQRLDIGNRLSVLHLAETDATDLAVLHPGYAYRNRNYNGPLPFFTHNDRAEPSCFRADLGFL